MSDVVKCCTLSGKHSHTCCAHSQRAAVVLSNSLIAGDNAFSQVNVWLSYFGAALRDISMSSHNYVYVPIIYLIFWNCHIWVCGKYAFLSYCNWLCSGLDITLCHLPFSAPYMRQWIRSVLVQIMPIRRKSLSAPMLEYCWFDLWEQNLVKSWSKFIHFHSIKCIQKGVCDMVAILSRPQCVEPVQGCYFGSRIWCNDARFRNIKYRYYQR